MANSMNYELIRFKKSSDIGFIEALKIYQQSISHDQKTNSSEIVYWVDNLKKFTYGELFFFGLRLNNLIIGYAELAYIAQNRIVIIDYIVLDASYGTNSSFYTFYTLILSYLSEHSFDYDFITKEILCRYNEAHIHKQDVSLYELENFKVVNCLYIQPQLEKNNIESAKEALVMLYIRATASMNLKKEAYMNIVSTIYDYYYFWDYPFCTEDDKFERKECAISNKKIISNSIIEESIRLNGYPFKYHASSEGLVIPTKNKHNLLIAFLCVFMMALLIIGTMYASKKLGFETKSIFYIGFAEVVTFLLFLILIDKNVLLILQKLPFLSKVCKLLE